MSRIYIPITEMSDWRRLLVDSGRHWKPGRSAMLMAETWLKANGFPQPIASVLTKAEEPIRSLVPLLVLPEHRVPLPGGPAASRSDVWVLASHSFGLASIAVEGKVRESFGETLAEWLVGASAGMQTRLAFLERTLGLSTPLPGTIRYQLLHRLASAVLEARRFHANVALCIIQSFGEKNEGFDAFQAFVGLFGKAAPPGEVISLGQLKGIARYIAWVRHPLSPAG